MNSVGRPRGLPVASACMPRGGELTLQYRHPERNISRDRSSYWNSQRIWEMLLPTRTSSSKHVSQSETTKMTAHVTCFLGSKFFELKDPRCTSYGPPHQLTTAKSWLEVRTGCRCYLLDTNDQRIKWHQLVDHSGSFTTNTGYN